MRFPMRSAASSGLRYTQLVSHDSHTPPRSPAWVRPAEFPLVSYQGRKQEAVSWPA
jgi:hypothetical protein